MSSIQLARKVWHTVRQTLGRHSKSLSVRNPVFEPILSAEEVVHYAESLGRVAGKTSQNLKQSEALRQGEQSSRFMGAGLEYEESRPYQIGDEIRRINWRLMARTGQAYTKLFQEERQENWFIVVDHRASMRFGTRKRLKATQAARVAGYYAWLAQQAGIPVAVGRLASGLQYSPIFEGKSCYSHVMEAICKACPPLSTKEQALEPRFNDVLLSLTQRLQPGSRLLLISDFHDVDHKTTEILTALQDQVAIKAVWIKDQVEDALPQVDGLQLQSMVDGQLYPISSTKQRQSYQAWSKKYQEQIQQTLQQANAKLYGVYAHEDLNSLNQSLHSELLNQEHSEQTQISGGAHG